MLMLFSGAVKNLVRITQENWLGIFLADVGRNLSGARTNSVSRSA